MTADWTKKVKEAEEKSVRAAQRVVALSLGENGKKFTREALWEGMKKYGLDGYETVVANLTQNMKKDADLFDGNSVDGWKLTALGKKTASAILAGDIVASGKVREGGVPKKKATTKKKAKKNVKPPKKGKKTTKKKTTKKKAKTTKKKAKAAAKAPTPKKRRKSKTAQSLTESPAPASAEA